MQARKTGLAHVPAKHALGLDPRVESGFADKDMRQQKNLPRFPFILDHRVIQYERETP
jgi:hypothetical protein